jgi:transcriptional regulator GlxA family with amidase domain
MIEFTLLLLEDLYASSFTNSLDMLAAAAALAPHMKAPAPRWRVFSCRGGRIQLLNGVSIEAEELRHAASQDSSFWINPGMGLNTAPTIQAHTAVTAIVAASCSSIFVLNSAGLLHGKRANSSRWLAPELRRVSPDCVVNADHILCNEQSIITAGAAFAQSI